ncbi:hypothetical protein H0H92_016020 [Tricholoma furcatifolium]|nr:hypothetical protein H0H92_016020 [Tricholoma furcatifolium]
MGNKQAQAHESRRAKDIGKLVEYIQSEKCKKIVLMLGAGVSTSAGIPDFRSPKTGLYSNLARLNLPQPEAVFEINFFRRNPVPFYTLAAELYPGAFRPTPTHSFIKLLSSHKLLHMCFTQNIDTLERRAGVPEDKIVEAHGSFATQRCIDCSTPFDDDEMRELVLGPRAPGEGVRIPKCKRVKCGGLVKPDIVFFGEALPPRFISEISAVKEADLLLIIGTSLTVHPFASLAGMADRKSCRRVLINLEKVGDIGRRPEDIVLLGECDVIVRDLCKALGWEKELDAAWEETASTVESVRKGEPSKGKENISEVHGKKEAQEEVEKLASAIEKELNLQGDAPATSSITSSSGSGTKTEDDAVRDRRVTEEEQDDSTIEKRAGDVPSAGTTGTT